MDQDEMGLSDSWDMAYEKQLADYKKYFDRVSFTLGNKSVDEIDMEEAIRRCETKDIPLELYTALFDYGRYLLISSSRSGTQAASFHNVDIWRKTTPAAGRAMCPSTFSD